MGNRNVSVLPLDYLLAVEGSLAMRGAVSKSLGSQSRSHAAFPFVFEGTETMTDDQGDITGLGDGFGFRSGLAPQRMANYCRSFWIHKLGCP